MHRVDITQMLCSLVRKGMLVADGVGRGKHYAISGAGMDAGAPPISAVQDSDVIYSFGACQGGFGVWCWDVAFEPAKIQDVILAHGQVVATMAQPGER